MILLNDTSYFSGVGTLVAIPGQSQDLSAASGPRTPPSQSCRESPRGSLSLAWSWPPVTFLKCRVSAETSSAALTGALTTSCPLSHFNCLWHPMLPSQMCKAVCGLRWPCCREQTSHLPGLCDDLTAFHGDRNDRAIPENSLTQWSYISGIILDFFFLLKIFTLDTSIWFLNHILFTLLPTNRHFAGFSLSKAIKTGAVTSSSLFGKYLGGKRVAPTVDIWLNFKKLTNCFPKYVYLSAFPLAAHEGANPSTFSPKPGTVLSLSHGGIQVYQNAVFICISLTLMMFNII